MALLAGKPVIQHVLERVKFIRAGKKYNNPIIILAVPDTDESQPMLELAQRLKVENYCGPEENVLERYYQAAIFFKLDFIIRITGDCPFIDPRVSSEVLQLLLWRKCDYTSNIFPKRTYPKGLDTEAFTMDALEVSYLYWKEENALREVGKLRGFQSTDYLAEHVTPFMQKHPEIVRALVSQQRNQSQKNWCVDEPEDIPRLEKILEKHKPKLVVNNDKRA